MNFNWTRTVLLAAAVTVSLNSFSQDLITRQTPANRELKSVDSLALQKQARAKQALYPELDLCPSWDNELVQAYDNATVPKSYISDLKSLCMPAEHIRVTDASGYHPRRRRVYHGLDIKVHVDDTIRAVFDDKVRITKNQGCCGHGKYVVIRHNNGLETMYGHLSKQSVDINQSAKIGEPIVSEGNTGCSTGSHLYFEAHFLGIPINPALTFDFEKRDIVADLYTFRKIKGTPGTAHSMVSGRGLFYKMKRDDTLSKTVARQGVSIDKFCKLNRITRKIIFRPGQVLHCS